MTPEIYMVATIETTCLQQKGNTLQVHFTLYILSKRQQFVSLAVLSLSIYKQMILYSSFCYVLLLKYCHMHKTRIKNRLRMSKNCTTGFNAV